MLNFNTDPASFREFVATHKQRVFNAVLNRVQSWEDAEEITQDIFIDVYRNPGAFRGDAAVSTWLYRIAMNKSIDWLRKKERHNKWLVTGLIKSKDDEKESPDFHHPGIVAEKKELAVYLFKALKKLPEKQYTAWQLLEMEQLSYKEISEVMKVSVSSVESLLFRARQNLKKILDGLYP